MVILDASVVIGLLVLVTVAALPAVVVLVAQASRLVVTHHRRRVSRHESVPSYYRHLATGH